ncbi:MAG: chemotaxis protein CheX [Desulfobulbaceae bacterium]|nr:chemotaxis protein CheX [Desulfobulbaceae bacterium]
MVASLDIGKEILVGTQEVFSTMLMIDISSNEIIEGKKVDINSNLTSMIGLGGGIRGVLAVHCPENVAKAITGDFLGMDVDELDDDVKDAIGEITNMVAGNLKVSYSKVDINVELAIPTSIVGDSFHVSGIADAQRVIVPMTIKHGEFWIELMYVLNS